MGENFVDLGFEIDLHVPENVPWRNIGNRKKQESIYLYIVDTGSSVLLFHVYVTTTNISFKKVLVFFFVLVFCNIKTLLYGLTTTYEI